MKCIIDFWFNLFFGKSIQTWSLFIEYAIGKNLINDPICICSTSTINTQFRYEFKNSCVLKSIVYMEQTNREVKHTVVYDLSQFAKEDIYIKRGDVLEFEFNPYTLSIQNFKINQPQFFSGGRV